MQYAERLPVLPSRRSIVVPAMALVLGAAAAVGGYALIDDQATVQALGEVVFVDVPAPGDGVRGIDDTAKAVTVTSAPATVIPYLSHGSGAEQPDSGNPTYPHGPGAPHLHR